MSLPPPRFEGSVQLEDGRRLGFAEYGPSRGRPVLWLHGTPGARRQIPPAARRFTQNGDARIIAIERPGVGQSTPHLHANVRGVAGDIASLADALEIERFALVGLSGGGPYVLACAYDMPRRVVAAAVLGGVAPSVGPDAARGGIVALTPWAAPVLSLVRGPLGRGMAGVNRALHPWADEATNLFLRLLPPGDQRVFSDPAMRRMFHDDIFRGGKRQMQAMFIDMVLFGRPWGFSPRDIRVPVHFWHGDADNIVPLAHGRHLAALVPGSTLRVRHEEGHLGSLGVAEEILRTVLDHFAASPPASGRGRRPRAGRRAAPRRRG
jgi:pimeloyl-ACP methyl ester carboxylesterase